jgi:small subunit ribosomal protein S3
MGQKVHPIGLRLGINQNWRSRWYGDKKTFGKLLNEDIKVRDFVKNKLFYSGVAKIELERVANRLRVIIHTARPGLVIGRKGTEIDKLKEELFEFSKNEINIDIVEIKQPELEAQLVAENIALQLIRRVSFRRAMKKAVQSALSSGAKGIKLSCSGRLGGAEIARREAYKEGSIPLHTLRALIDYGFAEAKTSFGKIGVKVWIFKGQEQTSISIAEPVKEVAAEQASEGKSKAKEAVHAPDAK